MTAPQMGAANPTSTGRMLFAIPHPHIFLPQRVQTLKTQTQKDGCAGHGLTVGRQRRAKRVDVCSPRLVSTHPHVDCCEFGGGSWRGGKRASLHNLDSLLVAAAGLGLGFIRV